MDPASVCRMSDVTRILSRIESGDPRAADELLPLVYDALRRLAAQKMIHEAADHTLQPTALVHEAYVRLVDGESAQRWDNRGHFYAAAAEAMRRILIEEARRKQTLRRGGGLVRLDFDEELAVADVTDAARLLALDEALQKLAVTDPESAKLVELRYFAGMTVDEAARLLDISPRTAKRNWAYARAWLQREMLHE